MKINLLTKFAPLVIGATLLVGCSTIGGFFNDKDLVLTSPEYIAAGDELVTVKINDLPEDLIKSIPETLQDEEFVVVEKDMIKDEDVPYIPLLVGSEAWEKALEDPNVTAGFFDAIMAVLLGLFPALAVWEGLLILLFRRKRDHWFSFVKKIIPWGNKDEGDVNISGAFLDVLRAVGGLHSSDATAAIFEDEKLDEDED